MWTIKQAISADSSHSSALISLPRRPVRSLAAPLEAEIPTEAAEIHPPRILIVDDEPLVRWSVAETLSHAGYDVVEAGTIALARAALDDRTAPLAAILLDLKLPDGEGLDVLEEARRANQFCPVIVMTAYGSPEVEARAKTLGAVAIVTKPFDLEPLLAIVRRACPPAA